MRKLVTVLLFAVGYLVYQNHLQWQHIQELENGTDTFSHHFAIGGAMVHLPDDDAVYWTMLYREQGR